MRAQYGAFGAPLRISLTLRSSKRFSVRRAEAVDDGEPALSASGPADTKSLLRGTDTLRLCLDISRGPLSALLILIGQITPSGESGQDTVVELEEQESGLLRCNGIV